MRFTFPKRNKRELKIRNVPLPPFLSSLSLIFLQKKKEKKHNNRIIMALH